VVICADTQETVGNLSKRNVAKVKVTPDYGGFSIVQDSDLVAAFCGAGDGPFTDKLTTKAWEATKACSSLQDACDAIEASLEKQYRKYANIYQCDPVHLIYGVKMGGESRLFSAVGSVVNEVEDKCTGGIGYYMADFLAARMYSGVLSLHQCVILAAYVLLQAKEHVDGCGGESHIAVLRNQAESGRIDATRISALTRLVDRVDRQLGEVLIASADLRTDTEIDGVLDSLKLMVEHHREEAREYINRPRLSDAILAPPGAEKDPLGFYIVKPSGSYRDKAT
jgi:hypothetical protein